MEASISWNLLTSRLRISLGQSGLPHSCQTVRINCCWVQTGKGPRDVQGNRSITGGSKHHVTIASIEITCENIFYAGFLLHWQPSGSLPYPFYGHKKVTVCNRIISSLPSSSFGPGFAATLDCCTDANNFFKCRNEILEENDDVSCVGEPAAGGINLQFNCSGSMADRFCGASCFGCWQRARWGNRARISWRVLRQW